MPAPLPCDAAALLLSHLQGGQDEQADLTTELLVHHMAGAEQCRIRGLLSQLSV